MGSTIAGTIVHLGHAFKIMMGLNTNPNLQLQVLILCLSKSVNQTAQFAESPFEYKIQKWFDLSPYIEPFGLVSIFRQA